MYFQIYNWGKIKLVKNYGQEEYIHGRSTVGAGGI